MQFKEKLYGYFPGEVLTSVLKEESPHEELFDYLNDSIIFFDQCPERFLNFHIAFMIGLSAYLGFEPGKRDDPKILFLI